MLNMIGRIIIGLFAFAIALIGGYLVATILADISDRVAKALLIVGLSAAAIINVIVISLYAAKGK